MTLTVTLNPCLDQTMTLAKFTHGGMNRVKNTRRDAAGKGINVSAALKGLGADSICTGINYVENGKLIEDYLNGLGIRHDFVYADGAVRTNIKLFEEDMQIMTEVNQPGAYVPPETVDELLLKIKNKKAAQTDLLVLSGSRPQGVNADIYHRILEQTEARVILDTEGEALLKALSGKHKPFLIKPNLFELETAFDVKLSSRADIASFGQKLTESGPEWVCVSMGGDGAMLIGREHAYYAPALNIPVRGVQGAGDAMVAGLVWGLSHKTEGAEWLRCAVAAASASVVREGTQLCTREGFDEMLTQVTVLPQAFA